MVAVTAVAVAVAAVAVVFGDINCNKTNDFMCNGSSGSMSKY